VAGLDAQVDDLGTQGRDLVLGLHDVGAQPVEIGFQRTDRRIPVGDVGAQANGHLLGGATTLLLASQRRSEVGLGGLVGHLGDETFDVRLPSLGPLQPQDADRVDELGQRPGSDRRAKRLVGVDRPAERSQRPGGNPGLAGHRTHLARHRDPDLPSGDLIAHHDGVLDGTAQVAVLDRCRTGHVLHPSRATSRTERVFLTRYMCS
jgi:hypothetical protein